MEPVTLLQRLEELAVRQITTESYLIAAFIPRRNPLAEFTGDLSPQREPKEITGTRYKLNEATKWYTDALVALREAFPREHAILDRWAEVTCKLSENSNNASDKTMLENARAVMASACDLLYSGYRSQQSLKGERRDDIILQVLRRFHTGIGSLTERRRKGKQEKSYAIEDEYDVQDLLVAVLKPYIPDLSWEDPVPKYAGDSGRIDLTSKAYRLGIEVKFAKDKKRAREIPKECRERVLSYQRFPEIEHLIFFIYDPDRRLEDPDNLILDMSNSRVLRSDEREMTLDVIISPFNVS